MILGIDASNLHGGGGVTHLTELLRSAQPELHGIERVVVWGRSPLLNALDTQPWLLKRNPSALNKGFIRRFFWLCFGLSNAARDESCSILFIPGGTYLGNFHPVVTMSQNLLPFDLVELRRYGATFLALRLFLLRLIQAYSFKKAAGVIFLTEFARNVVTKTVGRLYGLACTIPHGINSRFCAPPKRQRNISAYDSFRPYRILYVSIIDQYKHQWHVVEAVALLRELGLSVELDLVGPAYPPALSRLNQTMDTVDPERRWVHYHGTISFEELHLNYAKADLGLFASSCENMPNILLETMASGLPIACSNRGPMPEVLGDCGLYFDPENSESIADALLGLINSQQLRSDLANASYERVARYSWRRCANETFAFIAKVANYT